jgi:plastocyanin
MTRRRLVTATLALGLLLGATGFALSQTGAAASVAIRVFQFQPGVLEVPAGTRVTWTNHDDITHTVTSGAPGTPDGRFDVRLDGKGVSGGAVLSDRRAYPYFCARHPSMRGEVVVR